VVNRFYLIILIALVILLGYLSYQILEPFLVPIAWAVVFSILFYPLYAVILKYIRWPSITSLIVLVLILVIAIGPFTYLSISLVKEVGSLIDRMGKETFALQSILDHPAVRAAAGRITSLFNLDPEELNRAVGDQVSRWGTELIGRITAGIRNVLAVVVNFLIMSLTIFFLLPAGPKFFGRILQYLPFSEEQKGRLVKQVRDIIVSTLYGGVVIALVQGTAGGLVFFLLDISSPVLWGFAMSILEIFRTMGEENPP
jgi:predicted PurR-regulated permease PerM